MCESCTCNIVHTVPETTVGPAIQNAKSLTPTEWNEELSSMKRFHFGVALSGEEVFYSRQSMEDDPIEEGAICIIFCNDPSFVFNKMPPKATAGKFEGQYMSPSQQVDYYRHAEDDLSCYTEQDEEEMEAYLVYVEKQLKKSSLYHLGCLMYVLKDEGISSVDVEDFIYDKIVEVAIKKDNLQLNFDQITFVDKIKNKDWVGDWNGK